MIPDSIVEEIRERADLVEIVGRHVELKKSGSEFKALCPFHNERTPSFYVVPDKGFYKCFGCGEAGDVYDFLMKHVGLSFPEAVRQLGPEVGVDVPEDAPEKPEEPYRHLYEAIAFAADWFERNLQQDERGERARRYLEGRGVDAAAARRFRLGYAPREWHALAEAAHVHGISDETLLAAGLVKESEKSDEPYDRFRDRIIFPITDLRGRVIAFGGRVVDDRDQPKYLNSPETPVYQKGRTLFGLAWAKNAVRREGSVLIVEGNMDYVSLAARGIEHVVAPLGTAMTEEQAALLARYTSRALLLYDSDAAGQRASFRTADALLRAGVHPLIVPLPEGEDPDTIVRREGPDGLRRRIADADDVLDRKIAILEERDYFEDIDGRRRALDGLLPTIRAAMDPALRDLYIDRVVGRTGVRRETLEQELAERAARAERARSARAAAAAATGSATGAGGDAGTGGGAAAGPGMPADRRSADRPGGGSRGEAPAPAATSERLLILVLIRDPERVEHVGETLPVEALRDPVYREMYAALLRHGADEALPDRLSEPARRRLEQMREDPVDLSPTDRVLDDVLRTIKAEDLLARIEEIDSRMPFAGDEERLQIMRERKTASDSLRGLGMRVSPRWKERAPSRQPRHQRNEE